MHQARRPPSPSGVPPRLPRRACRLTRPTAGRASSGRAGSLQRQCMAAAGRPCDRRQDVLRQLARASARHRSRVGNVLPARPLLVELRLGSASMGSSTGRLQRCIYRIIVTREQIPTTDLQVLATTFELRTTILCGGSFKLSPDRDEPALSELLAAWLTYARKMRCMMSPGSVCVCVAHPSATPSVATR